MKIGIGAPFNPKVVEKYFDKEIKSKISNINISANSVNTYVETLLKLGHEVIVFTVNPFAKKDYIFIGNKIKIYIIAHKFFIRGFGRYRIHKKIRKYIEKELNNLDILHAEWTYEYAFAMLPFVKEKPVFCSVRDWCPYILSIVKGFKNKYYWLMSYFMFNKVIKQDKIHFIANSNYTYNCIKKKYPNYNIPIIFNPVKSEKILIERNKYPKNSIFVSISQSLCNVRKNYKTLLQAFHKYLEHESNAKLVLIGSYTDIWKKEMNIENLLKNVELKGNLSHEKIFDILDQASCLVHPSLEETFGNILLEAMSRRVPCIGGINSGAVPQVLGNGKYGVLCDVTDPQSVLGAMLKMEDKDYIMDIVNRSTSYLQNTYSDIIIAKQHIELFQKYINQQIENVKK